MDLNAIYLRSRFWFLDFLHGSPIRKQYNDVKYFAEHSEEEARSRKQTKLQQLLRYAQANSVFYSMYSSLNLSDYPVMNKMSLVENMEQIRVKDEVIPGQVGTVHIQRTSGSTGVPLAVAQDTLKRQRRIAELKYFGKVVGFTTHEKLVHLRTWNRWQSKTSKQIKTENIIPFDISKFDNSDMEELCNILINEKVVCLRGYATTISNLVNYIKASGKNWHFPCLKVVIAGGEALYDEVRQKVKDYMHCEIISQYADEECGILAQESVPTLAADNVMYFNQGSYYFEVLKLESDEPAEFGEVGRIVITDLHNYACPIIRYDCGDTCMLLPPNEQSKGYPIIGKLYGRRFDLTYSTDGKAISPLAYGRTLKNYDNISLWQFVQEGEKDYVLKLKIAKGDTSQFSELVKNFSEILGEGANLKIEEVDEIPVLSSGKRKPVVNNWKK